MHNKKYIYVYTMRINDIHDPIEAVIMPLIIDCGEVYHLHDDGTTTAIWLTTNMLLRLQNIKLGINQEQVNNLSKIIGQRNKLNVLKSYV